MADLSFAEEKFNLKKGSFPFESRFADIDGAKIHFVDEGKGPLLLMIHGNPTWTFLYRHLIRELCSDFRCVALDLPGFGLSDAPPGFTFRAEEHADLVARFLEIMGISSATLIAHDWGGPIGLAAGFKVRGSIAGLCLGNTWAWPVNGDFHFEWFSRLMGGPVGRFGTTRFALFINQVMPAAMKRRKLTDQEMQAYRAPFAAGRDRSPMFVFPREILASGSWLSQLETSVKAFNGQVNFIWPDRDIAFRRKELQRWTSIFPDAEIFELQNCGHYLWEDAPSECAAAIRTLLAKPI